MGRQPKAVATNADQTAKNDQTNTADQQSATPANETETSQNSTQPTNKPVNQRVIEDPTNQPIVSGHKAGLANIEGKATVMLQNVETSYKQELPTATAQALIKKYPNRYKVIEEGKK
jgi:hypothetical protein